MNLEELKKYLDDKFSEQNKRVDGQFESNSNLLDERFKNVELQLSYIKEQTTKTNGRVTKLEEREQINRISHLDCPVKKEFETYKGHLENDLFLIRFTRRYPRLVYGVAILLAIVVFSGGVGNIANVIAIAIKAILGI